MIIPLDKNYRIKCLSDKSGPYFKLQKHIFLLFWKTLDTSTSMLKIQTFYHMECLINNE